jgi:CheY-like chemotaxis protein
VEFEVRDTGIGISPEGMTRLFQRFYQVDSGADRKFGGTGLGLDISQSLATMMGGGVVAHSTAGVGSAFTLTLPLTVCAAPADSSADAAQLGQVKAASVSIASVVPAPGAADGTQASVRPSAPRVLVVEDHPVNSKFVGVLLSRLGCETVFFEDGQQALDRVREQMFDLILMDINMPVMDGLAATRAIGAMPSAIARVPIIVLTADTMNEARDQALAAGATDFLTKPVPIAQFRATMQAHLKGLAAP